MFRYAPADIGIGPGWFFNQFPARTPSDCETEQLIFQSSAVPLERQLIVEPVQLVLDPQPAIGLGCLAQQYL
jgi:hypothetical protein